MSGPIDHGSRSHALLSASSAHRWLRCPASAIAAEAYERTDSVYTAEGTRAHEIAEAIASGRPDVRFVSDAADGVTREMIDCAEAYRDYIGGLIQTPKPLLLFEQRVDFSPWVPDGFGTADCLLIQGGTMDVIDYKYGKGVPVSARDNPQEMLYGLGALNEYGFAFAVERVRLHIFQPRIDNVSTAELTAEELLSWGRDTVRPVAAQAARGEGGYAAGEHCRFCPHAGRCPTLHRLCTEYVESHGVSAEVPVLSPHELAEALRMKPVLELWLRRVGAQALNTLLGGGEVPGFKAVEGRKGDRTWTDEGLVTAALREYGCTTADICETRLRSPAAMEKAVGRQVVAGLLGDLIRRAPGQPLVVPDTDGRPPYDPTADFDTLTDQ